MSHVLDPWFNFDSSSLGRCLIEGDFPFYIMQKHSRDSILFTASLYDGEKSYIRQFNWRCKYPYTTDNSLIPSVQ